MSKSDLTELVVDFVEGLLKKAKVKHAGNCLVMCQIVQAYLLLFKIDTFLMNVIVKQGRKEINHYVLKMIDGTIIDATASQFKDMPKVYIGKMPKNYE
jgi:hypothetical protein